MWMRCCTNQLYTRLSTAIPSIPPFWAWMDTTLILV
jgi:hypothetical protein